MSGDQTGTSNYAINRSNFDASWLEPDDCDKNYTKFQHIPLKEKDKARKHVQAALTQAILDHHIPGEAAKGALERLGFVQAAKYLCERLPKHDKTRKGNFGEVVACEHLCQRYGYKLPVFKLRFMDNPDMPMRGEDIVAFEINEDNKIITICTGEAKTLERYNHNQVNVAHNRLVTTYRPYPISLFLISNILYERGDNNLAEQIDVILETLPLRPFPRHNWIFIITGNRPRNAFRHIEEMDGVVENLKTVNLHLPGLSSFINEIFDNPLSRS